MIETTNKITIDSGVSEHFAHRKYFFLSLEDVEPIVIEIIDGRQLKARRKGSIAIQLLTKEGGNASPVILKLVYFLPDLEMTVISVSKLAQSWKSTCFQQKLVLFNDMNLNHENLGCGFLSGHNGLYEVPVAVPDEKGNFSYARKKTLIKNIIYFGKKD